MAVLRTAMTAELRGAAVAQRPDSRHRHSIPQQRMKEKRASLSERPLKTGGGGGNRTRVPRSHPMSFYVCSL